MSFLKSVVQSGTKVLGHATDELHGLLNRDHRHDDPEEKAADAIRADIIASHRFMSFAGEREGCFVKWHVDGHDYMYALSEMLDSAREAIFILDWWLSPELYLRRPPAKHPEWRLDRVLKRKAEQGVKIHIVVYKEVTQTMSMGSKYTKNYLNGLHENIAVMRHPDHIGSKDSVQFWSHHEKVVVVDNHYAAIGGLDLCYGRWDTNAHPLADAHPSEWYKTLFPGQDYNNARIKDFQDVHYFASNAGVSIREGGRMPWHDVHMTLTGPVVLDIIQHFVERWNELKKRKYNNAKDQERFHWLSLPHDVQSAPNEAVVRHPHREQWAQIGRRYKQRFHRGYGEDGEDDDGEEPGYEQPSSSTCHVQAVRSVSDWSHGVLTEHSIQNAYIQMIREAVHCIYIENQFFISATKEGEQVVNLIGRALVERILRASHDGDKFKVIILIPEVPGFSGSIKEESALKMIMAAQYRTMNRGGSSIYESLRKEGVEPLDYIRFYHLRTYDRINTPFGYIKEIEERSGVSFLEAQVALSRLWIGHDVAEQSEVQLNLLDEERSAGGLGEAKVEGDVVKVKVPQTEQEARDIIQRFEDAAKSIRSDERVSDNVVQHSLQDRTTLADEQWEGTEEEERDAYVSELVYIHSKLMIVDDRRVIMGSANINDRSQKGDGDSEIALVVDDTDLVQSRMNGKPYMASRFASSLRRRLWREHLGLIDMPETDPENPTDYMRAAPHPNPVIDENEEAERLVVDPLADETFDLFNDTASKNTRLFAEIFRPVPTNNVRDWKVWDEYIPKVKTGHVIPGVDLARVKDRMSQVKGTVVECPLDFLIDEKEFVEGPAWKGLDPTLPIYI